MMCLCNQIDSSRLRHRLQRHLGFSPGNEQRRPVGGSTQHPGLHGQDQGQTGASSSLGLAREVTDPSRLTSHVLHALNFRWRVVDTVM